MREVNRVETSMLAPIVLFAYNRKTHVQRTIESLLRNELSELSEIYIFCDGPKMNATTSDLEKIEETRGFLESVRGFKSIKIEYQSNNLGLDNSIIYGINEVLNFSDRFILLEDDIVTAPIFLEYMNFGLQQYENEKRVFNISGYWFPVDNSDSLRDTFFLSMGSNWGWGTWADRWSQVYFDAEKWLLQFKGNNKAVNKLNIGNTMNYLSHLEKNLNTDYFTWDIFWHTLISFQNGLTLFPNRSLVQNIGHDNSGTHPVDSKKYSWDFLKTNFSAEKQPTIEYKEALERLKVYFKREFEAKPEEKRFQNKILKWFK